MVILRSMTSAIAMFIAAMGAPTSAIADEYSSRRVGGWFIGPFDDGQTCVMGMNYEGEGKTKLTMTIDLHGSINLSLLNDNWSIADGERLELEYFLSIGGYKNHPAFGYSSDGKKGFNSIFEDKFPGYLGRSTFLHVYRGTTLVDKLSLEGTGLAVAELYRCVAVLRTAATEEARKKRRFSQIPVDPFAKSADSTSGPSLEEQSDF